MRNLYILVLYSGTLEIVNESKKIMSFLPQTSEDNNIGGWDSWDVPSSVVSDGRGASQSSTSPPHMTLMQQQINQYRLSQQRKIQEPEPETEPEPNYFEVGCLN